MLSDLSEHKEHQVKTADVRGFLCLLKYTENIISGCVWCVHFGTLFKCNSCKWDFAYFPATRYAKSNMSNVDGIHWDSEACNQWKLWYLM